MFENFSFFLPPSQNSNKQRTCWNFLLNIPKQHHQWIATDWRSSNPTQPSSLKSMPRLRRVLTKLSRTSGVKERDPHHRNSSDEIRTCMLFCTLAYSKPRTATQISKIETQCRPYPNIGGISPSRTRVRQLLGVSWTIPDSRENSFGIVQRTIFTKTLYLHRIVYPKHTM